MAAPQTSSAFLPRIKYNNGIWKQQGKMNTRLTLPYHVCKITAENRGKHADKAWTTDRTMIKVLKRVSGKCQWVDFDSLSLRHCTAYQEITLKIQPECL
jgi:hypothetical protein